jgi:hypothetical protein
MYDPEDKDDSTGLARRKLVRWLGKAKNVGQALCYYVLKLNGRYAARSTVRPVKQEDYEMYPELRQEMKEFDEEIKVHIGSFDENLILQIAPDEVETPSAQEPLPDGTMPGDLEEPNEQDAVGARGFDPLIQAEVILPHGEGDGKSHWS